MINSTTSYLTAILTLKKAGYNVYYPPLTGESLIVEDQEGNLSKVFMRTASTCSKGSPVFTPTNISRWQSFVERHAYALLIEPESARVWLIPVKELPIDMKSIRLGDKWGDYEVKGEMTRLKMSELAARIAGAKELLTEDVDELLS